MARQSAAAVRVVIPWQSRRLLALQANAAARQWQQRQLSKYLLSLFIWPTTTNPPRDELHELLCLTDTAADDREGCLQKVACISSKCRQQQQQLSKYLPSMFYGPQQTKPPRDELCLTDTAVVSSLEVLQSRPIRTAMQSVAEFLRRTNACINNTLFVVYLVDFTALNENIKIVNVLI